MIDQALSDAFALAKEAFREHNKIAKACLPIVASVVDVITLKHKEIIVRIESRVKDFESIRDNYVKDFGIPRSPISLDELLRDRNDILGVRVIVYRNQDVDMICASLETVFSKVEKDEKLTERDIERGALFGYRAVHLNLEFDDMKILNLGFQRRLMVEIQIRTILSDAWSRHSHKFVYKGKDKPSDKLIRDFAFTAAMLENVDEKIDGLSNDVVVDKRKSLSSELNKQQIFDQIIAEFKPPLAEDDLHAFFLEFADNLNLEHEEAVVRFYREVKIAWEALKGFDFAKHGIHGSINMLRVALFGRDKQSYDWVLPLHARSRMGQVLSNFKSGSQ